MGSLRGLLAAGAIACLALCLCGCEKKNEKQIRQVDGHFFLMNNQGWGEYYIHDPLCPKCREWRVAGHVYDVDLDGVMTHKEDCEGCYD